MNRSSIRAAIVPIGMLTRNTQRQLKLSVSHPPRTGPRIGPIMTPPPNSAIARAWRLGGLMSNNVAWAKGTRKAPLTPWRMRKPTISGRVCATAQKKEATVKPITDQSSSRLRPTRSASQPEIGKAIAEATM
jgi:hypothetical protein